MTKSKTASRVAALAVALALGALVLSALAKIQEQSKSGMSDLEERVEKLEERAK